MNCNWSWPIFIFQLIWKTEKNQTNRKRTFFWSDSDHMLTDLIKFGFERAVARGGGWSAFKSGQASDSETCALGRLGYWRWLWVNVLFQSPIALSHAHTHAHMQHTSAEASDVTSIRFSARKAKTAAARTKRALQIIDVSLKSFSLPLRYLRCCVSSSLRISLQH